MITEVSQLNKMTPTFCTKCGWKGTVGDCNPEYAQAVCPKCNYAVFTFEVIKSEFVKELEQLINKHSMENGSNTPDFILAHYMANCLRSFNEAIRARDKWHTVPPTDGPAQPPIPMSQFDLAK